MGVLSVNSFRRLITEGVILIDVAPEAPDVLGPEGNGPLPCPVELDRASHIEDEDRLPGIALDRSDVVAPKALPLDGVAVLPPDGGSRILQARLGAGGQPQAARELNDRPFGRTDPDRHLGPFRRRGWGGERTSLVARPSQNRRPSLALSLCRFGPQCHRPVAHSDRRRRTPRLSLALSGVSVVCAGGGGRPIYRSIRVG